MASSAVQSFVDEGQGVGNLTEDELKQRKSAAVKAWMVRHLLLMTIW